MLLYQSLYGIKANILRVASLYGERQRINTAQGAVGVFLSKALGNEPIEIWGDGSVIRDYVYVGDVADAFSKAFYYDGSYSVFNIGSGCIKNLNELLDVIKDALGIELVVRFFPITFKHLRDAVPFVRGLCLRL